jgi:WD40 repeat protein
LNLSGKSNPQNNLSGKHSVPVLFDWSTHTMPTPAENERQRYLLELLDTTARTIERQTRRLKEQNREDLDTLLLVLGELRAIRQELEPSPSPIPPSPPHHNRFTLEIIPMIGNIAAGTSGTFSLSLLLNAAADTVDPVSAVTWSSPDPSVTVAPSTDGQSAVFTVPATDVATTLVANAAGTVTVVTGSPSNLPVGFTATVSGSASVPVSPSSAPQVFTLSIVQTA